MAAVEMPTAYDPKAVEARQYERWLERGAFDAEVRPDKKPYCIVIPPPNVTGLLHTGHALDSAIQDLLIRWHRMMGYETLWLPGMDHAGIATQNVVERQLAHEGLTRHDLGREKFVQRVWQVANEHRSRIRQQLQRLGVSCDWRRERFTLDEGCSRAVREAFVTLYEAGLIYRGKRMVDWCPRCHTGISDIEVEHVETNGHLWHIRYPGLNGAPSVVVATTRPETMLGDTAVAVHPDDERHADLVGRHVLLPLMQRPIPVIADPQVDPDFGTGAVKITPAHDPDDFEIGNRHNLQRIEVIGLDARMTERAGEFAGLTREECRQRVVAALEERELLVNVEPHVHAVGHCSRCHTVVEPLVSEQWFLKMDEPARRGIEAVRTGRVRFVPPRWEKMYLDWLENTRDWCISRQLWWGHRIPIWYCRGCREEICAREDPQCCPKCGAQVQQETDVLDTWFSSALWPFSTLGWPDDTPELRYFHPTSCLVTAYDIITFWVVRMVTMDLMLNDEIPFPVVFIHGLVRDEKGRKISKSLGNDIDPLELMEQYGTDAVRFAMLSLITHGQDITFSPDKFVGARNFCNKLWNASRLVLTNLDGNANVPVPADHDQELADRWILARLSATIAAVQRQLEKYDLADATRTLYQFVWDEFCDWYLEMAKADLYGHDPQRRQAVRGVLVKVLTDVLKLLHPFMPFITEEIWQRAHGDDACLALENWPTLGPRDESAEAEMRRLIEVVRAVRNLRADLGLPPQKRVKVSLIADTAHAATVLTDQARHIASLAGAEPLLIAHAPAERPSRALSAVAAGVECFVIPQADMDFSAEIERLGKQIARLEKELAQNERKLANAGFLENAPAEVVEAVRAKAEQAASAIEKLRHRIAALERLG
ncbi:MAG: valine--tRNA ligase [Armatimonadota bacterium]